MAKIRNFSYKRGRRSHRQSLSTYPENKYGYDVLIKLRNHEHTILWTKFNYYLVINSIVLVFLSAIFSNLGKTEWTGNETINNITFVAMNSLSTQQPIQHVYPIFIVLIIVSFLGFFIALISSRILMGSNFWINYWEHKLSIIESKAMKDANSKRSELKFFREHPSLIMKEKSTRYLEKKSEYLSEGYKSTRRSIIWLSWFIVVIWAILFLIFVNICFGSVVIFLMIFLIIITVIFYFWETVGFKLKRIIFDAK